MSKQVKTKELFDIETEYLKGLFDNCEYPWEVLPKIGEYAESLIKNGIDGFVEYSKGVLVGKNVKIYQNVTIEPPCIIGGGCEIRPGAFLRGKIIIGNNCVIGNSTELKNCVLMNNVQVPHYNYVGDSVLGNFAHMGAGSICSNLKSDKSHVVVKGDDNIETGLKKFGAVLADFADIGCGSVLNPGTVVGKNTNVYPLTSVRGVIPSNCIVKNSTTIIEKEERN